MPVPYGSICCTYHQLKYSSHNLSNKQKDKSDAKKPTFRKMEVMGEKTIGAKSRKGYDRTRQKNKRRYRTVGSNW